MKSKKKILLVFGTRPEAIKMSPLVKTLQADEMRFETRVCVTGQHREMLQQVLDFFEITPDVDLHIMKEGQTLHDVTVRILSGMREVLEAERPDMVLVHGDTTTSMASALAAFYAQIPVGHVEAGLRTHQIYSPFPEEMNRQLTGRIATLHFAPTEQARRNLLAEGVAAERIFVTGNTVIDALFWTLRKVQPRKTLPVRRMVLVTGHRRENFGEGFLHAFGALKRLAKEHADVDFVFPVHPNPQVRKALREIFGETSSLVNLRFVAPPPYPDFVRLMSQCTLVLTDSGGIQEEAPALGKPVLVMRDTSERPEAVEAGTARLVGTDAERIVREVSLLLDDPAAREKMSSATNPYGDGHACERIVKILSEN